ncbi:ABC transporter ATP-binding protein/permease [Actinomycetospora endophytica]|uniref:ABC transporter ATP-binding protein/permease n=1 Tax=Actinomycetospora endophytica TaxID=2291215 RepID=A0ABS8PHF7_9PSEU|nr:ABC transporter ATP-binding protein [Actinomycetospora endophytica]MCD2197599.1 ABC transporter ATP-binding protein/permease [Actinomycetospora endophytica]
MTAGRTTTRGAGADAERPGVLPDDPSPGSPPAAHGLVIDGRPLPALDAPDARGVLRRAVRGQARFVVPASVFAMVHQACEAAVPVLIGITVDRAIAQHSLPSLLVTLGAMVVLFLVLTSSMRAGGRLVRRATQGAGHEMRVRVASRVLDPRGTEPGTVKTGELLSTATSDAQRVGMVNAAVWTAAGAAAALVVGAALLVQASVLLGLVVILGLVPVSLLTTLISRPLVRRSAVEQAAAARAAGTATDFLAGLRVLKGLGAEAVAAARYAAASATSRDAAIRAAVVIALRTAVVTALTGLFLAVVAFLGARLALTGQISVGEFISALGLTQFLLGPFTRIAAVGAQIARARASAGRIADVLAAPAAVPAGGVFSLPPGPLALEVHGVGGRLDLVVLAGERVGIVVSDAESRAAVETLLTCLAREADPERGTIRLGGVDLDDVDPVAARERLLVAHHDAVLFTGTLAENLGLGVPGLDEAAVRRAVRAADADQVAEVVPGGYDAVLTERGRSLSGGQRQRVALARALAADTDVLVLADPTTGVDGVTEALIAERVAALRAGRTTLTVTRSPALLAGTDRVVVISGGRVRAEGTHAELAGIDAAYRELVLR